MIARWLSVLSTYDFTIEYRRGSAHTNADALSRKPHRICKNSNSSDCEQKQNSSQKVSKIVPKDQDVWTNSKDTYVSVNNQGPVINQGPDKDSPKSENEPVDVATDRGVLIDINSTDVFVVNQVNPISDADKEKLDSENDNSPEDFNQGNWVQSRSTEQIKQ